MNIQNHNPINLADEQEIRRTLAETEHYQDNPEKFCEHFRKDATLVNVAGIRLTGKDEIYAFLKKARESFLSNVTTRNEVENITFIRPDVVVVSVVQHIYLQQESGPEPTAKGNVTLVLVKEQDAWMVAVGQNTFIRESSP